MFKNKVSFSGGLLKWTGAPWGHLFKFKLSRDKIILAVFALSCLYLTASYVYPWLALRKIKLPLLRQGGPAVAEITSKTEIRPLDFYLKNIKTSSMFSRLRQAKEVASSVNVDLTKDIELVGIISGENPQAAIQDKKTQKVYYLNKGQFMEDFQLEDIQEGKVILNYKGQRIELQL